MESPAAVWRDIQQEICATSNGFIVQIHKLARGFDAVIFARMPEPTRPDGYIALPRQPFGSVSVACRSLSVSGVARSGRAAVFADQVICCPGSIVGIS